MLPRLIAIGFIFLSTTIAWMVLGSLTLYRTYEADDNLKSRVEATWGESQNQNQPRMTYPVKVKKEREEYSEGREVIRLVEVTQPKPIPLEGSDIQVDFHLDHRQKGLLWYSTYAVDFKGSYRFLNDSGKEREITVTFPFPADSAIYDDFNLELEGGDWKAPLELKDASYTGQVNLAAGKELILRVRYRSQGMERWRYSFRKSYQVSSVKDFRLVMTTNFEDIDFPAKTMSPTTKTRQGEGWKLEWKFKSLLAGFDIGMTMPTKLQPGPLAGKISFFAPVSLFFFIVMLLVMALVRNVAIHPMHFFFLSCAFFAFHLLLNYLVDHISIHFSFVVSAVVSMALVATYLRPAISGKFALRYALPLQAIFLVAFSYTFFFKGYTGLAITIGAVISLFVAMQLTAKADWNEVFRTRAKSE